MRILLALASLAAVSNALADERMADVAVFLHAVWFSEEFNDHCPESPIEVPVSESTLREILVLENGGNFVDVVARDPSIPEMDFREDMKELAKASVVEGCDSETALMLREKTEKELVVPSLVEELLKEAAHPVRDTM